MEGNTPQVLVTPEAQTEVKDIHQTPQQVAEQPPTTPLTPAEQPPSEKPKRKALIFLIVIPILAIVAYGIFLATTYWNCNQINPRTCETNSCTFSLAGFNPITETKENCCGNTKCELGETNSDCSTDCPNCDDQSECTKDSYDYDEKQCSYEQLFSPCHLRTVTLDPATSKDDYQVKIELSLSNFDYSEAMEDGEDIRIFDQDNSPLSFWIEEWNKEGASTIWVKVASSATDKIYMAYGYPGVSSVSNGSEVFDFFEGFDYESEKELVKVWSKQGQPTIELSNGVVTISSSETEGDQGQHIYKDIGSAVLLNNIFEIKAQRFSEYQSHMANVGYTSSAGGSISDGNTWAALRYSPSPDGSLVVFGGNHGSITSSPTGSFNTIKIYHRGGTSYAYEPPGTKVAQYLWPNEPPPGDYVLLGGATNSGSGKASYDWIRVRKYTSYEPVATLGDEKTASESSTLKELY